MCLGLLRFFFTIVVILYRNRQNKSQTRTKTGVPSLIIALTCDKGVKRQKQSSVRMLKICFRSRLKKIQIQMLCAISLGFSRLFTFSVQVDYDKHSPLKVMTASVNIIKCCSLYSVHLSGIKFFRKQKDGQNTQKYKKKRSLFPKYWIVGEGGKYSIGNIRIYFAVIGNN